MLQTLVGVYFASVGVMHVVVADGLPTWHASRGEWQDLGFNLVLVAAAGFVAYVRWRRHPLPMGKMGKPMVRRRGATG